MSSSPPPSIAILGWGSLLWDARPEFDEQHNDWKFDGPEVPIEFSRISETRHQALTLVLDAKNGTLCKVAYALSKRRDPRDAFCDLRSREGTTARNIGCYCADGAITQAREKSSLEIIRNWAASKEIEVVVWTDLASNFTDRTKQPFSTSCAINHLASLNDEGKLAAREYILRSPDFVITPLKTAFMLDDRFSRNST